MAEELLLLSLRPASSGTIEDPARVGTAPCVETDNFHAPDSHRLEQEPVTLSYQPMGNPGSAALAEPGQGVCRVRIAVQVGWGPFG